ncbi:AAA domain-containing protein [Paenibacillus sp. NPDC058174]|uniref:AAA domain-containing protein n=1 Tax=Paenibacillus sp. NPDC058174 TaxID=3346366 RepID=UPI0036DD0782
MSTGLREVLQYFIRYEDYSRFMNTSLSAIDGEHLSEETLIKLQEIQDMLDRKQKDAILRKLESYRDIRKKTNKIMLSRWNESISSVLSGIIDIEDFITNLPFQYPDNRDQFKSYVNQLVTEDEFTICYPLMIKDLPTSKKDRLVRPVITFKSRLTEDGIQVSSFVINRASLEIILAEAEGCPVEDVRVIADKTYTDLCTKIDSIESTQLNQIISLIDQCLNEQITNWKYKSLLDFKTYSGWLMSRRLFITKEGLKEMKETIFKSELERLLERQANCTSSILNKYIFGNRLAVDYTLEPSEISHHLGSYTADYPVNNKQWRIIQSLQNSQLLAINGPPGTGKTTLIKEMIADAIVRKACLLINVWDQPWELIDAGQIRAYYQSPLAGKNPFSMVITSTNNKAVDNIGIELTNDVNFLNAVALLIDKDLDNDILSTKVSSDEESGEYGEELNLVSDDEEEGTNSNGFMISDRIKNESKSQGFFCARLGNMTNMNEFRSNMFEVLTKGLKHPHITSLKNEEVRIMFKSSLTKIEEIHKLIDHFWKLLLICLENGDLDDNRDLLASIENRKREVEKLNEEFNDQVIKQGELIQIKLKREDDIFKLKKLILELESELKAVEENRRQAYADKETLTKWKRFPQKLFSFLPKRKLFLTSNPTLEFIQGTRINPLTQDIKSIAESLKQSQFQITNYRSDLLLVNEQLIDVSQRLELLDQSKGLLQKSLSNLEVLFKQERNLKKELQIEKTLSSYSYFELANAPIVVDLRKRLFEEALAVNEQYVIKYSNEIVFNLEKMGEQQRWFKSFYSEKGRRLDQYQKGIRAIWESFFLCFPVATTTLHSFSERLFQSLPGLIDTLFVDEAGQIMPHYLCAPLFRSQKAVVVGDPEQLEPVRTFSLNLIEESNVKEELQDTICILQNSAQDYADRGSEFFEYMGMKKKGIILNEHRRCESNIMRFSNFHVYNEMLSLTKEDNVDKLFGGNLVAFDIRGLKDSFLHRNFSEISACHKIVNLLVQRYGTHILGDIGIITPFSSQAKELASVVTGVEVGTVHTFQGKEKRFILFSSVIDGIHIKNAGLSFVIGSKPNMLNVAFSRAKEQFIFVGNLETGLASGNYLAKAIQMIQQHGVSYSLFNGEYENEKSISRRSEAYAVYQDHHEINGIDSSFIDSVNDLLHANVLLSPKRHHALMIKAIEYCRSSLGIVSPWVNSNVMNESFFLLLKAAKDRQVDIRVRFGYSSSKLTINEIDKIVERDNFSYGNKESIKTALKELHGQLGQNLVYMPPLHTKVLLIDNKILFIGSYNWLSNPGKLAREEISYLITDKQAIDYVKQRFGL